MPQSRGKRTGYSRMLNEVLVIPLPHWPPAIQPSKLTSPTAAIGGDNRCYSAEWFRTFEEAIRKDDMREAEAL